MRDPLFALPHEDVLVNGQPYYKQVFEGVREEVEIMSEQEGKLVYLGKLRDLLPAEYFDGSISADSRTAENSFTPEELTDAKERLVTTYVPVTKGANVRCMEDRNVVGYDDGDPKSYELGPQIQGGTIDIAVATHALADGVGENDTLESDIDETVAEANTDFAPAGHTDESHTDLGEMGCGAQKGQETKLDYYLDAAKMGAIKKVVGAVYNAVGATLPETALANLPQNAGKLKGVAQSYFKDIATALDHLVQQHNPRAKEVVQGKHNGVMAVINMVPGTTINTGKFNAVTDGRIMAFGMDGWYALETYKEKAPYLFADFLATGMNLTDGSPDVFLRLPAEA